MSPSASASFMAKASEAIQLLNAITALVPSNLRQGLGDMYLNQIKLPTAYLPPSHHHQPTQPADPPRIPSHTQHYRSTKSENEPLSQEQTNQLMEMLTARRPQTAMPAPPVITNPPSAPHPPAHPQKRRTRSNASRNQPVHPNPHLLTPPTISCDRLVPVPHVKRTEDSPSSGRTLNPTDNTSASRTPSFNADDRVSRSASFNSDGAPSCNASRSTSFCSDGSLSRTGSFLSDTGISPSSSFSMESVSRCPSFASMDSSQPVIRSASFTVGESGKSSDSVKRVMSFSAESVKDIKDTSATSAPLSAPTLRHSTQGPATFNPPPIPAISITHHGDPENILPAIMRTRNTTQRPQSQENDDCEVSAGSGSGTSSDSGEPDKKPRVPSVSANAKMKRHQRALGPYQRIVSIPPPNSMPPVTCEPPDKLHSLVDFCELKGSQQHSKVKQENSGGGVTVSPRQQKLAPIHVSIPSPSQSSSSASPSQSPPTNQQGFTQQQPRQQAMPVLPSIFPHPPTSSPAPITVNTQPAPSQPQPQLQLQLPQPQQLQQQNPPQTQPQAAEGTTPTNISPNTLKRLFSIDSLIS
ncbi:hypothetical protein Pelo_18362 [Pelomyxa schiedti]|nr:hypothetical protein Pelo_18362 [Pelomyxa schiedti]